MKKGHRDFVVVISAYVNDRLRVIALLPARTKAVVEAFFEAFPSAYGARSRLSARTFTKASSGPRRPCSANASSSARTAFMSLACIARDSKPCASASSSELRRTLSKASIDELKNAHWVLRHRRADLNADERRLLNRIFAHSPKLKEAYEACEALTAIYDSRLSKGQSKRKLRGWMRRVTNRKLTCFDRFLGTLRDPLRGDHELFRRPPDQWLCGRAQQ
nr:transposase [Thiocapsa sp.]